MIPKDSELRESLEMFTGYSNSVSKRGKVPKHVITAMKVLEAHLNTPEGWPKKKDTSEKGIR